MPDHLGHSARIAAARSAIEYICGRSDEEQAAPEFAAWAHSAIDQLTDDLDRRCYFSMTGGEGDPRLWAWHAASELGMHRLDVEMALGHEHSMTPVQALDAANYTCRFFLQAMRRVLERDPGRLTARLVDAGEMVGSINIEPLPESASPAAAVIEGPPIQSIRCGRRRAVLRRAGRPRDEARPRTGGHQHADRAQRLVLPCPRC